MYRSTPRERDAMALAARFGVDPRNVGKIMNDAGHAVLDRINIPDSTEGLQDVYGNPAIARAIFGNSEVAAEFHTRFANKWARSAAGREALKDIDDQAARGAANQAIPDDLDQKANAEAFRLLQSLMNGTDSDRVKLQRLNLDPRAGTVPPEVRRAGGVYNKYSPGARAYNKGEFGPEDSGAEYTIGDFAIAAHPDNISNVPKTHRKLRQRIEEVRDAYSGTVPGDGGFLVPEEFRAELLQVALEQSIVRSRARVIPMNALKLRIPTIDASTNVGSVNGGMVAYWTEESAALVESQARFGSVLLEAQKLTGLSVVPNELVADAPGFGAFIEGSWPEAIRFFEDLAFLQGSGVGEPLALLGNAATVVQAAVSGQGANTIKAANIFAMYSRMLPSSAGRAVWLVAQDAMPQLMALAGADSSPLFINNIAVGGPVTILGRPVIFTEKLDALGSQGDIAFVDLGFYLIGDRMTMQMARSEHAKFLFDQTAFRIIERVDGRPWLNTPITPVNGGPTLSAFVELNASRT